MPKEETVTKLIICEDCDSEFTLKYNPKLVSNDGEIYCPFCGSTVEHEEDTNEEADPEDLDDYDDEFED